MKTTQWTVEFLTGGKWVAKTTHDNEADAVRSADFAAGMGWKTRVTEIDPEWTDRVGQHFSGVVRYGYAPQGCYFDGTVIKQSGDFFMVRANTERYLAYTLSFRNIIGGEFSQAVTK